MSMCLSNRLLHLPVCVRVRARESHARVCRLIPVAFYETNATEMSTQAYSLRSTDMFVYLQLLL